MDSITIILIIVFLALAIIIFWTTVNPIPSFRTVTTETATIQMEENLPKYDPPLPDYSSLSGSPGCSGSPAHSVGT